MSRGSRRTPSETARPGEREEAGGEPGHGEVVRVETAPREHRPEHERPPDRARDDGEQHDRHAARAALRREHLGRGGAREQHDRLRGAAQAEAEEHEHALPPVAAGGRHERAGDPEDVARSDHRHPADAVGQSPRRPDRQCPGDEEHRRAEAEDAVDAGDGHDRHRPERDCELDHPRLEHEPQREQQRVPAHIVHWSIRPCGAGADAGPVEVGRR